MAFLACTLTLAITLTLTLTRGPRYPTPKPLKHRQVRNAGLR